MAQPIVFTPPLRDRREELIHQLQRAPNEHVEALLDVFAILQLLRDKGVLESAKGILGSGERVLGILTETMETEQVVRTVRNLTILFKLMGSIQPETLENVIRELGRSAESEKKKKPPGMLKLLGKLTKRSTRRALAPVAASIEAFGENLGPTSGKGTRKKTTRHAA